MRKKFTMLLASLFLTLGTAKAELVDDGVYAIVNKAYSTAIAENNSTHKLFSATRDANNYRQLWLLETGSDGKYTLRNAVSGRYVKVINGIYNIWETANEGMELYVRVQTAATGEAPDYYYITSEENPATTNYAPCAHSSNGNIVGWTHTADASQWDFVSQSEIAISTLVENVKQDLSSDITLAESLLDNTVLEGNTELHNSLSTAFSTVKALGNDDLSAALDAAVALRTAIAPAETFINTIAETNQLANNEYYKLYGHRGFIYAADGVIKGTNVVSATYDANNMNQHFAIIKKNDKYYLYNVGAKKFVVKSGNNTTLVDLPEQPITLESTGNADYAWSIKLNGTNKINLSSGWNSYGIYTDYNGTDEGNRWAIYRVGTFDNSEALARFDMVYVTINYVLGSKKTVTVKDIATPGDTYSFTNPYVYTTATSCTKGDETLTANNGTYSFEVTEATTVTVNLEEDLPFALSEDYNNAIWYRLKIRPNNGNGNTPKWVVRKAEKPYDNTTDTPTDNNGLWAFVGNAIDGVQVLNKEAGADQTLGFDNMNTNSPAYMKEGATTWTLGKLAKDGYEGFLLRQGTTGNNYLHDYSSKLAFWNNSGAPTDLGSAFIAEAPLSITYLYKGEELTEYKVDTYVNYGTVHTITNPFANKYVNVTCAVNGNRVEAVDGQWTVNVTEPTSVIVTITEDLPFKISKDFATANWQYLQINSASWKYVRNFVAEGDGNTYSNTTDVAALGDNAQWAFVGDALNGFKILNKTAGDGYTLSFDGEMGNGTAAYMKQEEKTWTIEKGNGGFVIRQGATQCLNDFNSKLKVWQDNASPAGTGSAFRTISGGVTDLAALCLPGIFTLQAERSPLLYDANAGEPTKLSSGMVSNIPANAKDSRQQFMISESDTDGLYYLYNIAAARFVDANLNFTDYPEPVLSFEANPANPVFPWFVKIGGKYVVPGSNGEVNKIFHTSTPAEDDGKRYRIEYVDEDMSLAQAVAMVIQHADGLLKDASSLSNSVVYTVSTYGNGSWYYNSEKEALWRTETANPEDKAQQFAFLTVGGKTYLYSVGAGQFVVKSGDNTAYSPVPTQPVELLKAEGYKFFPIVVAFVDGDTRHHIGISPGYEIPVITWYNNLADEGNKVDIRMAGNLENYEEIVAEMETYLTAQTLVPELQALIAKAELALTYLLDADGTALAAAKTTAEEILAAGSYTAEMLGEQISALSTALNNATLVDDYTEFKNDYVYTLVSPRGWLGADGNDYLISANNGTADEAYFHWAVYKSEGGKYYLYNIGKEMFMGAVSSGDLPFAEKPQSTELTIMTTGVAEYPIMFSTDGGSSSVNHGNSAEEVINATVWSGGCSDPADEGNTHKVTVAGQIDANVLAVIKGVVDVFEATQALGDAISAVQALANNMDKLGYYSSSNENFEAEFNAIKDFKAAITAETTVDAINEQITAANNLVATFTVFNVPQAGKFYRLKGKASGKYMSTPLSTDAASRVKMRLSDNSKDAGCIFYLTAKNKLLSYKLGTFLQNTHDINALGEDNGNTVSFNKSESNNLGFFTLKTDYSGSKYIYDDKNDTEVDRNGGYAANNCEWTVEEVDTLPVTITNAQITFDGQQKYVSTLFTPVALEVPTGITAYIGVKEDNYLAMDSIAGVGEAAAIIPANTGVILMAGEAKTYEFSISAAAGTAIEAEANFITGTVAKTVITPDANTTCYVLANGEDGVGLYRASLNKNDGKGFINNACKAYIPVSEAEPQAAKALTMRLGRGSQGGTTSIESSELNAQGAQLIYDLQGRRVLNPTKGMYIVNGKKVIVK